MKKNEASPVWHLLEARWSTLTDHCRAYLSRRVYVRWERRAAEELLKLDANVPLRTILETIGAVFYVREDQPWTIKDDNAFRVQMTRRLRGLTRTNAGSYWNHDRRRVTLVYRELPPKSASAFGQWIIDALGLACLKLVRLDAEDAARVAAEKTAYREAVKGLQ